MKGLAMIAAFAAASTYPITPESCASNMGPEMEKLLREQADRDRRRMQAARGETGTGRSRGAQKRREKRLKKRGF